MTSIYEAHPDYLQSKRWQTIRRWRLWLDGNRCRTCPNRESLHTHHVRYRWLAQAWLFRPIADTCPWWMLPEVFWFLRRIGTVLETMNAITLCRDCHGGVHGAQPIEVFREGLKVE